MSLTLDPFAGAGGGPPGWAPPDLRPEPADGRVLAVVALAAVGADLLVRPGLGVGPALLVALVAGGLAASGRAPSAAARSIAAAATVIGLFLAVRTSPWLVPLDALAAAGLLGLAASHARGGDPFDLSVPALAARGALALTHACGAPWFLASWRPARGPSGARVGRAVPAVGRGILLAAPLLALLGLLLASADPVFASFFRLPTGAPGLAGHTALLALGGGAMAALLRLASAEPVDPLPPVRRRLGFVEAVTVLASLVALYAVFAVAQLVAVLGGAERVIRTAGLTYADYARSGFFQLLAVATITLAALMAVRAAADLSSPERHRRFVLLAEAAVVLTLLVVAVAVRRLHLYEQAFGLTMLRLFSTVFALWVGVVFVLLALALAGVHARRHWLVPGALAAGLAALVALNLVNAEALVVRRNLDHLERSGRLDAGYLTSLSDDAVPALAGALESLDPASRELVRRRVCDAPRPGGGWLAHHVGRSRADAARLRAC